MKYKIGDIINICNIYLGIIIKTENEFYKFKIIKSLNKNWIVETIVEQSQDFVENYNKNKFLSNNKLAKLLFL